MVHISPLSWSIERLLTYETSKIRLGEEANKSLREFHVKQHTWGAGQRLTLRAAFNASASWNTDIA